MSGVYKLKSHGILLQCVENLADRMMRVALLLFITATITLSGIVAEERQKRQADNTLDPYLITLCADKDPKEYFRISDKECRDVARCTESGLRGLRCPHGLLFDVDIQSCNWQDLVTNCELIAKLKSIKPRTNTQEPVCEDGENELACGDGTCIAKVKFCDGVADCTDSSDEHNDFCKSNDPNSAPICDYEECKLPDCFCYKPGKYKRLPGNLPKKQIPQMILITFDDAVNHANMDLYEYIFNGQRTNPNGCTIKSTFFVSHKFTNYTAVQELSRQGHEIAVHSISHNESQYWLDATPTTWSAELNGARKIITEFANISQQDSPIYGARSAYFTLGGNSQFQSMQDEFFLYDSSIMVPFSDGPLWPYILYYKQPHKCHGQVTQKCPTRPFAIWEVPINSYDRRNNKGDDKLPVCPMVDSCFTMAPTGEEFINFLDLNFERHNGLHSNNAPFGLFFHSAFLKNNPEILDAFTAWIDDKLANSPDVYFVTMTQALLWMQAPTALEQIANFAPWKENCIPLGEPACPGTANNCELVSDELPGQTFRMSTCMPCPAKYPWVNDPSGNAIF